MTFTLINASAGSGKTYTLTHRIADRMREGLAPSQLIATTFTRKAAAELTDRVRRTLLEEGMTEQARGTDSALVGTVNAVFGQLLQEFALDAGISPEVRVLDEEQQRAAFSAAIDEAASGIGPAARDLVARFELDGTDDPDPTRGETPSWTAVVRRLAEAARSNQLDAAHLRAASCASWEEFAAALPARGTVDDRPAWLSRLGSALAELRSDAAAGELSAAAARTVTGRLPELEQLHRRLAQGARAPWSLWTRIAKVARAKLGDPGATAYAYSKDVDAALLGPAQSIHEQLLAQPALHDDVRDLIGLVMETAAASLDAYARHKRELGLIDFIDQEVGALDLIRSSERVRAAIRDRFHLLAVDEFQDTSPVQLALFLELSLLIEDKIWVGDPKQAIYGFRGADPALMVGILEQIRSGASALGPGTTEDLQDSWRSQEQVLDLVSAVFPRIFPELPHAQVAMRAAPDAVRRRAAAGREPGRLEGWLTEPVLSRSGSPKRPTIAQRTAAVADGVAELLAEPGTDPGDVAVLVRTNTRRAAVVEALAARGIPASGEGASVLATREGRLIRAGLALALDRSDTLALTELVDLLAEHRAHRTWFAQLAAAEDRAAREGVLETWWQDESLAALRRLREDCISLTPREMITALIDALDLPERIRTWPAPEQGLRILDAVRALAAEYADRARAASAPITLTGLRAELDATERGPDLDGIPGTVWVGTIHMAKGLEWSKVVLLLEPDPSDRPQTSGVFVVPAAELDVTDPLAGRSVRCWPPVLPGFAPLQDALAATEHARRRARAEREEAGRLQYVAFTRAQDVTALAGDGSAPQLDLLLDGGADTPSLLGWSSGDSSIRVADGPELPARIRTLRTDPPVGRGHEPARSPLAITDLPGLRSAASIDAPRTAGARFQASAVASAQELGEVLAPRSIGPRLVDQGGRDWDRVGEAVHAYLALPLAELGSAQREQAAQRLVERWSVARAIGPEVLLRAGEAWHRYLAAEHPGTRLLTEQPITWWNEDAQVMEGWIDALLRNEDGSHVLVDHKSFPGEDPAAHVREHHLGQLDTYARALESAGLSVGAVLIHLPLRGEVLEVRLARAARPEEPVDA
ncbi:UvrD-helicase domain-containing protein [Brachybacterium hainanense]|uniref:DNA 3'-5' helicase n=1 Tax=Brachybacterium hainanense TaxID=1541174 RepID=A0ABV6RDP7_9MICO